MFYVQTYYSADCLKKRYEMGPESPTQVLDSLKAEYLVKLKTETLAAVLSEVKNETPNWWEWVCSFTADHPYIFSGLAVSFYGEILLSYSYGGFTVGVSWNKVFLNYSYGDNSSNAPLPLIKDIQISDNVLCHLRKHTEITIPP